MSQPHQRASRTKHKFLKAFVAIFAARYRDVLLAEAAVLKLERRTKL
jgi:hypothetical protein